MNTSLNTYNQILCSAQESYIFYRSLAFLLEEDPYFMPAYLEHVWYAQKLHDHVGERKILADAQKRIRAICLNSDIRKKVASDWSSCEKEAALELLQLLQKHQRGAQRLQTSLQRRFITHSVIPRVQVDTEFHGYLIRERQYDPKPLQKEVLSAESYWWNFDTTRSTINLNHQHTSLVALRSIPEHKTTYTPADGVHESVPHPEHGRFPLVYQTVMEFAHEAQLGLGRVALVKMQGFHQSYRHYDSEDYLVGRRRYHLIIDSGPGNLLTAGTDTVMAKPGELWFFDNTVMHRAHNKSARERIHVIFDGYPLSS